MEKIKIGWLFPDTLYLHGERGNILALKRFAAMAGLEPQIEKIDFRTRDFDPMDYDILFCPPGEIVSFPVVLAWLQPYKEQLTAFVDAGRPLLATGTSVALWCETVRRTDGTSFSGMGLLKAEAVEKEAVYGDDIWFSCRYGHAEMEIIGNQIQMVDLTGDSEEPFGTLLYGYGNSGKDRCEGFRKKNSIFTNTLGPMLALSPRLTLEIVKTAALNRDLPWEEPDYDDALEQASFATKKEFIQKKETRLTNCSR